MDCLNELGRADLLKGQMGDALAGEQVRRSSGWGAADQTSQKREPRDVPRDDNGKQERTGWAKRWRAGALMLQRGSGTADASRGNSDGWTDREMKADYDAWLWGSGAAVASSGNSNGRADRAIKTG